MRRTDPGQLAFVFADSPQGGKGARPSDGSGAKAFLLHIAKPTSRVKRRRGSRRRVGRARSLAWGQNERSTQRAGCVVHKSGSVRGAAGQPAVPTRQPEGGAQPPPLGTGPRARCEAKPSASSNG